MTILSQYKDIKVTFSQNVLYHMKDDFFCRKKQITQKWLKLGFLREGHTHTHTLIILASILQAPFQVFIYLLR